MREVPMLFRTPMVRAIRNNTKNQTRRIDDGRILLPGDRIWVKETTALNPLSNAVIYKADYPDDFEAWKNVKWTPSMLMHKWKCKTWLEVTGFWVEPLQNISEQDAINEGIEFTELGWRNYLKKKPDFGFTNPIDSFASLWKSLNGPNSWDMNPNVKRIQFKIMQNDQSTRTHNYSY